MENIVIEDYKVKTIGGERIIIFDVSYDVDKVVSVEHVKFGGNGPNNVRIVEMQPDRAKTQVSISKNLLSKLINNDVYK